MARDRASWARRAYEISTRVCGVPPKFGSLVIVHRV
jgi:hypothetical protein